MRGLCVQGVHGCVYRVCLWLCVQGVCGLCVQGLLVAVCGGSARAVCAGHAWAMYAVCGGLCGRGSSCPPVSKHFLHLLFLWPLTSTSIKAEAELRRESAGLFLNIRKTHFSPGHLFVIWVSDWL